MIRIESLESLRGLAEWWDDLWLRGASTLPLFRAEMLAQWVERFCRPGDFYAIAVETAGGLSAALPLLRRGKAASGWMRLPPFSHAATLPGNEWSAAGDLLLDEGDSSDRALQCLAEGIRASGVSLLRLDEVEPDSARWRRFLHVCVKVGMSVAALPRWEVGQVAIDHDWPAYKARWSRKHRQQMNQSARRLAERGETRLEVRSRLAAEEVEPVLRCCIEIEDRGWKGATGTSVLRSPGMIEFFLRQARQAARWG